MPGLVHTGRVHLFTYGSLMFPRVWNNVVGRPFPSAPASLRGFQILQVRDEAFPGIVAGPDASAVRGIVYSHLDHESLRRLDEFESDFYSREPVQVNLDNGDLLECQAYVVREENRKRLSERPWNAQDFEQRYLDYFLTSYFGFTDRDSQ